MMFQKKRIFKNKKIRVGFSIVDFPAKPSKQKKQVALKKSLRLHTRGTPAAEWINFLKKIIFFQNYWSGPRAYLGADRRRKSPLDGATDFLATIWQPITTVSFSLAFILILTRKPKNASKRLWIGPKHNSVDFKSLCVCLPIDRWSCVHPVYAGKKL